MGYTFGKPRPAVPQTIVGEIPATDIVLSLVTRIKLVVRVPGHLARAGSDLGADAFEEPDLRKTVADALLGVDVNGFTAVSVAVEQFEDAGG